MKKRRGAGGDPLVTSEERELIRYRLRRDLETLDEAALLHEKGHLNAYVNRLYYACLYSERFLLSYLPTTI